MTSAASSSQLASAWPDILATARTYQFDRYIAATLSPRSERRDLIVLAAFAGEMVRIPLSVSDPTIGAIRLQWWRDALLNVETGKTGNPLADAVLDVVQRHGLPAGLLVGYIDSREIELYADLVEDMYALKLHFQKSDGALFELAALILNANTNAALTRAQRGEFIQHAGLAYGLSQSLGELRLRATGRQLLIPADRAKVHGISVEITDFTKQAGALRAIVEELSQTALAAFTKLRRETVRRDTRTHAALLPTVLTPAYLRGAARQFEAALSKDTRPSPLLKTWQMFLAYWRGRL